MVTISLQPMRELTEWRECIKILYRRGALGAWPTYRVYVVQRVDEEIQEKNDDDKEAARPRTPAAEKSKQITSQIITTIQYDIGLMNGMSERMPIIL